MFGFFKNKNKDKVVTKDKVGDNSKDKKKDRANKEEKDAKATIRKGKEDKASKSIFRKSRSIELIKEANEEPSIAAKKRRTLEAVALEGWQEDEDSPHRGNGTEGEDNTHSSNSGSSEEAHRPSSPASPAEHSHDGCANGEKRPASSKTASSSPSERGLQLKPGSDHKRHGQNSIGFLVSAATKQCTSVLTGAVGCSQLPHDGGGEKVMNRARLPGTESIRLPGNAAPLVMKPPLNPRVVAPRGPLASLPSTGSGLTNVLSAEDERDESRHTPSPGVVTPPSSPGLPYGQAVPPYPVITGPSSRPTSPDGQASMLSTPSSSTSSLSSLTARPISPSGRRTPPGPRMGTGGKLTSSPTTGRKTVRTNIKTNPTVVSRRAGSRSPVNTCPSPVNPCPSPSPSTTTADVLIPNFDGERLKTPPSSPIPTRRLGDPSETSVPSTPPPPQQQPNVVATPGVFPHSSVPDTTTTQPVPVVTTTPAAVPAVKPRLSSPSPPPKSSLPCEVKAEPVSKLTPRSVSPTAGKSRHSVASMHSLESIPENDSDGQTSANDTLEKNCKMKAILGSKASDPLQKPTENKSSTNHGLTSSSARLTAPEASSNGGISHKRSSSLTPVNEEMLSHTSQPKTEPRANPKAMEINDTSGATQHQDGPQGASREHHDGGALENSEKKGISHHKKEEDVRNDQRLHMMGNAVVAMEEIPAKRMNLQSRTSVSGHDAFSQPPVKSCASSVQEMVYGGDSGKAVSGSPLRKEPISSTQTTAKEAGMKKMDVARERDNVKETKDVRRNKTVDSSHNQFSTLSSEDGETSGTPTHVVLRIPLRYSPLPNGKDVERRVSAEILLGRGGNGSADKERERRMERPRSVSSSREMGRERNSSDLLTRRRLASEGAETNGEMKDKVRGKVCRRSSSSSSQRHRPSVADQTSDETSSFAHENDDGKGSNDEVIVPWRKGTRSRSRVTKNPGRTKVIEDAVEPGQRNVNRNDSNFRSSLACHRTRSLSTGRGAVDVQERSAPGMDVLRSGEKNNAPIPLRQSSRVTAPPRHRSKTRGTERRSTAETLSENMRVKDDLETSTDGEYESRRRRRAQSSSRALDTFRHSEEANAIELSKTALDRDAESARKPPRRRRSLSSNRRSSGSLRVERGDGVRLVARSRSDARDMAVTNAVVGRNREVENVRRDPREFTRHESGYSQIKNGETNDSRNKSDIGSNRSNNSSDAAEAFKGATDCPVRLEQHSLPSEDAANVAANGDRSSLDHANTSRRISVQQHTPVVLTASQHCQTDDETNKIHTRSVQQQTPVVHTTSQHCQTDDEEANKNQTRSVQQQTPVVHTTSQHCQTDDEEANKNQTRSVQQQTPVVCTISQHCQTDDEEANKKQTISAYQQTLEVPTNSQHCQTDDEENKTVTRSVQQQTLEVPTSSQHCQTDDEEENKILTRSVQQQTLEVPTTSQHCQTDDDDEAARILQDTKDQASKELAAQEERYQKQVDQLTISLAEKQEEVSKLTQTLETLKGAQEALTNSEELQETLALLQQDVRDRAAQADSLRTELQYSKNEVELTKTKLKKLEEDLDAARQKNVALQNQITATANCNKTEELEAKIKTLEETLKTTEEERDKLSKTMEEIEAEREEEIKIIQDALDEAAQEREELIATFEKELQNMNTRNSNREQQLMEDFEWKLREMEKEHKKKLDERDRKAEERINAVRNMVESELADSLIKVAEDRRIADEKLCEVGHLKSYEAEVIQLRGVTHELQKALRASAREMGHLKMREKILEEEIRGLKKAQPGRQVGQNTLHRAKRQAEEAEAEFRQKQEKMKNELNAEWEDKLRSECSRLKAELDDLHAEEKHLAVESMKVQKEQEIRALKQSWELRQEEMTKEISTLKDSLTDKDAYYHKELENMRTNADRDVWELRRKLQRLDEKNWTQQEYLQEKHHEEMERMRADYKERVADLEANLAVAMQNSDEDSRAQMEKTHNDEMEHLCEQHRLSMERLREELEAEKYQAVEEARVIVSKHLEYVNSSLREQLAEAVSNSTQYREELEAVRSALALREEVISTHEEELARLKGTDGAAASSDMASQSSLASSSDSGSSHSSSNSQDRLSLSESLGASVESQDDAHKSGGGSLLGKVFGGGWFSSSKTKETSRRGSAPAKQSS